MDEVLKFILRNQHQFGYIMQEASRQWIANDPVGALTVGECNFVIEKYGQYHEILEKMQRYEKALRFYANKGHYEPFREEVEDRVDAFNFIDLDGGETAREALEGKINTVDIVEYEGKRWSVIGGSYTHYIATEPYEEMDGDTIKIPKNKAKIIK